MVLVHIGFGFFAEMTLSEALDSTDRRKAMLQERMQQLQRLGAQLRVAIKLTMELVVRRALVDQGQAALTGSHSDGGQ